MKRRAGQNMCWPQWQKKSLSKRTARLKGWRAEPDQSLPIMPPAVSAFFLVLVVSVPAAVIVLCFFVLLPSAPPEETRKMQRWVNNKWLFYSVKDFKDYERFLYQAYPLIPYDSVLQNSWHRVQKSLTALTSGHYVQKLYLHLSAGVRRTVSAFPYFQQNFSLWWHQSVPKGKQQDTEQFPKRTTRQFSKWYKENSRAESKAKSEEAQKAKSVPKGKQLYGK